MKRNLFLLPLLIALVAVFSAFVPRSAKADVNFSYFYDNLSPYGEWVQVDNDYCWHPTGMPVDWRPYTDGYWTYTDAGWTWLSYEDFGAITYHYGRWARIEDFGWVWKPGYEWGPAWVSWRKSNDYIGWAPLPFEAHFREGIGISVWADRDYDIGPSAYMFCDFGHFGAPVLSAVILPPERNLVIINETVNITNISSARGGVVFNGGPDYAMVAARSERPIQTLRLQRVADVAGRPGAARVVGNQLVMPAPVISHAAAKQPLVPQNVAKVIAKPRIDTGWSGVSDPAVKQQIKAKIASDTQGKTAQNAPAKPANMKEVQAALPSKASPQGTPGGMSRGAAAAASSAARQPTATQPTTRQPTATQPTTRQPEATQPAARQPVAQPSVEKQTESRPAAKPERTAPAESRPAAAPARPAQTERPTAVPQERPAATRPAATAAPQERRVEHAAPQPKPERAAPAQHEEARPERATGRGSQGDDKKKKSSEQ